MNNKFNTNLINQYKNTELYNEELFDFILSKTDINELKNNQYDIVYQNGVQIKGNIEAYLYRGIEYNEEIKMAMYEKIQYKYKKEILKPLYFLKFDSKEYILENEGFEIFKNINEYLKKCVINRVSSLTDTEEKFVIDWFFKEPPSIYLQKEQINEINLLYSILLHQKEYLNKRNDKSKVNNFFENHGIKKILGLFTQEQRENLMANKLSHEEIINAYYPKLLRQKHFDLAQQLNQFKSKDIVTYLLENVSDKPEEWFKPFLEKGSALTMSELNNKLLLKPVPFTGKERKKVSLALQGGIDLLRKIHPELQDNKLIKFIFAAVIEAENERLYLELRSFVELPQDEIFRQYINQKAIHKKPIDVIEKEVLKNRLEDKFDAKPKVKPTKI